MFFLCHFIFITAVPPRTRKPASTTPPVPAVRRLPPKVPTKTPVDDSEDYATLCPVINDDDVPTTSGTGDSGYCGVEEWKQHMQHPPPFEGKIVYLIYAVTICLLECGHMTWFLQAAWSIYFKWLH